MNTPRQTATIVQQKLANAGIRPDARRGQNFLVDLNLLELLVHEADIQADDVVLEVGSGTGSLTSQLAQRAAAVVTVEVDSRLQQLANEALIDFDNVTMLRQDVLRNKNNIHVAVLEAIQDTMQAMSASRWKLAANLPYSIATPLISNLLEGPLVPHTMTVTIQKELADRIMARPSTKDYGALSVWVQTLCESRIVRILPPSVFWPRPKVHSAIIQIVPQPCRRVAFDDLKTFHGFVRSLFFHRRKFMRSVLVAALKPRLGKPDIDIIMEQMQLGPDSRSEQLTIEQIHQLFECVRKKLQQIDTQPRA